MGRVGRICCVGLPMLLTLGAIICLAIQFAANSSPTGSLSKIYYFQMDTRGFSDAASGKISELVNTAETLSNTDINSNLVSVIDAAKKASNVQDGYSIGLWNYCSGPYVNEVYSPNFCSPKSRDFYFNPIDVWKLDPAVAGSVLPPNLLGALKEYQRASRWNIIAHIVAISLLCGAFVLGFFAMFSRFGSFIVAIIMFLATLITVVAAGLATAIYVTISAALMGTLKPYGIHSLLGARGFAVEWIGVAFALAASMFWLLSVCCCKSSPSSPAYRAPPPPMHQYGYHPVHPARKEENI